MFITRDNYLSYFFFPNYSGVNIRYALVGKYEFEVNSTHDGHEKIEIIQDFRHPEFDYSQRTNDQLILKLRTPSSKPYVHVNFDPDIPSQDQQTVINVLGLGQLEFEGSRPKVLQQVSVDYVPNDECGSVSTTQFSYVDHITPDMICIRGLEQGQCNGDSGGPYLILGEGSSTEQDVVVGVASW